MTSQPFMNICLSLTGQSHRCPRDGMRVYFDHYALFFIPTHLPTIRITLPHWHVMYHHVQVYVLGLSIFDILNTCTYKLVSIAKEAN